MPPRANFDQLSTPNLRRSKKTTAAEEAERKQMAVTMGADVVAMLQRPRLADVVHRIRGEIAKRFPDNPRLQVFDPLVELAHLAADDGIPLDMRLFALDRLRRYWYPELKPEEPGAGEKDAQSQDDRRQMAAKILMALNKLEAKTGDVTDAKVVEGEVLPPGKK